MIGVIGTAPAEGTISCGTPDAHGGNMDTKIITEGTTLLLPVNVPGALLAMGDLHAGMGDGEVGISGLEIKGCWPWVIYTLAWATARWAFPAWKSKAR